MLSHAEKRVFETSNTLNPALAFTFAVATPEPRHVHRDPPRLVAGEFGPNSNAVFVQLSAELLDKSECDQ